MKPHITILLPVMVLAASCQPVNRSDQAAQWKQEIEQTEAAFAQMALDSGIEAAFLEFAAEEAVLMRNNQLVKGREAMREWFADRPADPSRIKLEWKPDFVEVSAAGDLGYTYGPYMFTATDSLGATQTQTGIFHTVWKRQADGSWRFVWD